MLFPYKYFPHQIEKMQEFIDFIFYEVWCKAPGNGPFRLELFDGNTDLKEVMVLFQYGDTKSGDFFYGHVDRIYGQFAQLTQSQIDQVKQWYRANNNIERVCANAPQSCIARYGDIATIHDELSKELGGFFRLLYSHLDAAPLKQKVGDIDDHYLAFMRENDVRKCPFCGMADMQGVYHSSREAYDHYLPKALYPFNSVNFRNLVPACHHCNSSYKGAKDPAYCPKDPAQATARRKVFYPFTLDDYKIEIKIELRTADIERLTPADIELQFGPPELGEQIETWKDVYGIEERYKAKCSAGTDSSYWVVQALDECQNGGKSAEEVLASLARGAKSHPFAESNFLKHAFLDACHRIGIFDQALSGKAH